MREAAARLCETRFQPRPLFGAVTGAALLLEVLAVVADEIRRLPLPGDEP
jgi:MoxR-like ATPase